METKEIKALIQAVDASSLQQFVFKNEDLEIVMSKLETDALNAKGIDQAASSVDVLAAEKAGQAEATSAPDPAAEEATKEEESFSGQVVTSPIVGVVYLAPGPDRDPYVSLGQTIQAGETVCIVEAMKIMNEIPAECSGTISQILVKDGEVVEYGQPLFEIS
ncbi:acetyl-CoA carboxylase biotin carboxyl carrier protein [Aerococcus sp. UMB1112A]|uniref:acetyl-CoA carboxylase biotin carboxyl carrier protein n=1 Tax=Aerococcus sp. UMB1112A TaxID=3050609 RepID=UPI00254AF6DA|nr:acetyl-CoA carboxylase biotin carboxyl carrier protein [Aerococcus sp. UMB1112A]MDK8501509.1 acetyl-CoA carboxylase biotin carboxyl carrier protein [Aerococcus sp. UMB1112A]